MLALNRTVIDYFSLDIEGEEHAVGGGELNWFGMLLVILYIGYD